MAADPNRFTIVAAFGAIYFLWVELTSVSPLGIQSIPPFLLMGSRSIIGGAILLPLAVAKTKSGVALR